MNNMSNYCNPASLDHLANKLIELANTITQNDIDHLWDDELDKLCSKVAHINKYILPKEPIKKPFIGINPAYITSLRNMPPHDLGIMMERLNGCEAVFIDNLLRDAYKFPACCIEFNDYRLSLADFIELLPNHYRVPDYTKTESTPVITPLCDVEEGVVDRLKDCINSRSGWLYDRFTDMSDNNKNYGIFYGYRISWDDFLSLVPYDMIPEDLLTINRKVKEIESIFKSVPIYKFPYGIVRMYAGGYTIDFDQIDNIINNYK